MKQKMMKSEMEKKKYPIGIEYYDLKKEIGNGGSATVHSAICIPLQEEVAIKIVDLQNLKGCDDPIAAVAQESHTMLQINDPNVLKSHCSFVTESEIWIVMPYMSGGSCHHLLKSDVYKNGIHDECFLATILFEALKGLAYLHKNGIIHRDIKAGNIFVDAKTGSIKLGDLGVSASLFDNSDRTKSRHTVTGTPGWMAPEVVAPQPCYGFKADIWSFGITALELAYGHAPFYGLSPTKVLLNILSKAPPGIKNYEKEAGDLKFSSSFKQLIATCLVKDPNKRPSSQELLKHPFLKKARSESVILKMLKALPVAIIEGRLESMRAKEDELLEKLNNKLMSDCCNYKQDIIEWDFDMDAIKKQAPTLPEKRVALVQSVQSCSGTEVSQASSYMTSDWVFSKPVCAM